MYIFSHISTFAPPPSTCLLHQLQVYVTHMQLQHFQVHVHLTKFHLILTQFHLIHILHIGVNIVVLIIHMKAVQ